MAFVRSVVRAMLSGELTTDGPVFVCHALISALPHAPFFDTLGTNICIPLVSEMATSVNTSLR